MQIEQCIFFAEWKDPASQDIRQFKLLYFTTDDTLEMWDMKNQRLFLRRIKSGGITLSDIYSGAIVKIFSRSMLITGYADQITETYMNTVAQKTLGILKPNSMDKKSTILKLISSNDFRIVNLRMANIDETQGSVLYEEFMDEEFYRKLIKSLTEGPSLIFELLGKNAVSRWLELIGPDDPNDAKISASESIRAQFGIDRINDVMYTSRSPLALTKDLELFFPKRNPKACELNLALSMVNSTCCVIKPHIIKDGKMTDIICMIEEELGFKITAMRMCYLSIDEAEDFYEVYKTVLEHYRGMVDELSSGPCLAMEISASDDINTPDEFRQRVGPFDPELARKLRPNTIRARFGKTKVENAVHVSDIPEDAIIELQYFFQQV